MSASESSVAATLTHQGTSWGPGVSQNSDQRFDFLLQYRKRRTLALKSLRRILRSEIGQFGGAIREVEFIHQFSQEPVLDNLFKLLDWSGAGQIRLDDFSHFIRSKVRTEEGRTLVDSLEARAFAIAENGIITLENFHPLVSFQTVLSTLFKLTAGIDTYATADGIMNFIADSTHVEWKAELGEWQLRWANNLFRKHMRADCHIYFEDLKGIIQAKNPFFVNRVFQIFDQDGSGGISWIEFKQNIQQYCGPHVANQILFIFQLYDLDNDGRITLDELKCVLEACGEENGLQLPDHKLNDLSRTLFNHINSEGLEGITFTQLRRFLESQRDLDNLSKSIVQWLLPIAIKTKDEQSTLYRFSVNYVANNWPFVIFLLFFSGMNIGLFVHRAIEIWHVQESANQTLGQAIFAVLARGSGRALCFNSILVVILMFRLSITFLRVRGFGNYLPLDKHIFLHKLCGIAIVFFSFVHTTAHVFNFCIILGENSSMCIELLFTMNDYGNNLGLITGFASISGWVLVAIVLAMALTSLPAVRRKGHFEVFYWTHLLYIPYWIFEILHCPNFWKWFVAPGAIFVIELLVRSYRKWTARGNTSIESVAILPSEVTRLIIKRPKGFHFHPGDFVFVRIPRIASWEWHPFAISSAPEDPEFLSLHIRAVGNWTKKLYELGQSWRIELPTKQFLPRIYISNSFQSLSTEQADGNQSDKVRDVKKTPNSKKDSSLIIDAIALSEEWSTWESTQPIFQSLPIKVTIDGPYGVPASQIFRVKHAVLIATGIGVTPFASILQSIMYRYHSQCPECKHSWVSDTEKLKKVDFIWINRDSRNVTWFYDMLSKFENQQNATTSRFLDIHIYITSILRRTDIKAVGLQSALDLLYERDQRDKITGLQTRTKASRPDWDQVFRHLKQQSKGKVTVFYCGVPTLTSELAKKCAEYDFHFRKDM